MPLSCAGGPRLQTPQGVITHHSLRGVILTRGPGLIASTRTNSPRRCEVVGMTSCPPVGRLFPEMPLLRAQPPPRVLTWSFLAQHLQLCSETPAFWKLSMTPSPFRDVSCSAHPCLPNLRCVFLSLLLACIFKMSVLVGSFLAGRNQLSFIFLSPVPVVLGIK